MRNYVKSFCFPNNIHRLVDEVRVAEVLLHRRQQEILMRQRRRRFQLSNTNNNDGATMLHENEELVLKVKTYTDESNNLSKKLGGEVEKELNDSDSKERIGQKLNDNDPKQRSDENEEAIVVHDEKNNLNTNINKEIDDEAVCCTICMIKINNGDKIGEIPCKHIFHTHCLKQWLCRRNVCPLCLTPNIASIRSKARNNTSSQDNINLNIAMNNSSYNSDQRSLLLIAASNNRHNVLAGNGIASGSVNMIAQTMMNLNSVTSNIQNSFFGSRNNNATSADNNDDNDDRNDNGVNNV